MPPKAAATSSRPSAAVHGDGTGEGPDAGSTVYIVYQHDDDPGPLPSRIRRLDAVITYPG
ncbi:uncharacterized protein ColSpa_03683 [Colletotrichum spaethianum]|uniref:Uncharacterized protein n=1 Tax=Colletotrichum spaethianum TaxID=700344 RepID=A0AA37L810_9PEZI|nr:uncharacterized protein ColSpa_03683 [Colletotrichum spaethianum]GKT43502.1 hypothetical protein ColSpa_03683 [Colletotrichum spaethianum]